ncbi:MAG: SUMF1/EgtB/PvdO family nonheme iron enzyme [bacterium]|nr:SUMF1/EgtB/PvdO family nonheme iron enzyme [bacterium]
MKSTSKQFVLWTWLIALLVMAILPTGCGKEDLYTIPDSPYKVVGRLPLPSINTGVDVLGDYAYVSGGQAGIHVIDISDPGSPALVKTINTIKFADGVQVIRTFANHEVVDIAMIVEGTEGVTTYNITDPSSAEPFGQGTTAVNGKGLCIVEREDPDEPFIAFLAETWKGVRVFESDPVYPGVLAYHGAFVGTRGYAMDVAYKDGYGFIADDQMGLIVIDFHTLVLHEMPEVGWIDTLGNALSIAIKGDYAFIADKRQGMAVFDISDPANPTHVTQLPLDSWCLDIEIRDNLAFIAADDAGLHIVDITNPTAPKYAGNVRTPFATGVCVTESGLVLVTDENDGLYVLQGPAFADVAPPAPCYNLGATVLNHNSIEVSWFSPGDDRFEGIATSFDLRYASTEILTEGDWAAATVVAGIPVPEVVGTEHTFTVAGLTPETDYHFALRTSDEVGHISNLGPNASATTYPEGTYLAGGGVSSTFGLYTSTYTFSITYFDSDGDEPVTHDVVIDGTPVAMTHVSGTFQLGALYSYEGSLATGSHDFYFSFDDGNGHAVETPVGPEISVGVYIFDQGSPEDEPGRDADELQHPVMLTRELICSPTEVTQAEWTALVGSNPSTYVGDDLPVHNITWLQAINYCNLLSASEGMDAVYTVVGSDASGVSCDFEANGWRLPTEAEWEYFCRAGATTALCNGEITIVEPLQEDPNLAAVGWYDWNTSDLPDPDQTAALLQPQPVGGKAPNALGLYDMHGNVREMCWDWYVAYQEGEVMDPTGLAGGYQKVIRGGAWDLGPAYSRSANREMIPPASASEFPNIGFRVVRRNISG